MTTKFINGLRRVSRFLRRQAREIGEGGLPVLFQKGCIFLTLLLLVPVVPVIWALRPLVLIRFGPLQGIRLGHFALNTELYLCERDAGLQDQRAFDIFYHWSPVCNQQLKKMWDRTLRVCRLARFVDMLNHRLPGGKKHVIPMPSDRDIHGLMDRMPAHLSFTTEEERLGHEALQELGIPEGAPFVCFHARDPAYLQSQLQLQNMDLSYHDYRDSTIHNYLPAVEELVRRGYYAIRMGAVAEERLNTGNPQIIDYTFKGRSEFMDIYLCANCRFFLGSASGLTALCRAFRVPVAYVNMVPLNHDPSTGLAISFGTHDLFIPKKLWLRKERRFLTFREILNSGAGMFVRSEQYEQFGVEVVENTPEEITALAVEMDERLKGTWRTNEEDEELQRRFWSLFNPTHICYGSLSRIGAEFLRQNQELLD